MRIIITIVLFVFFTVAIAEDWPQWRGSKGDGISREVGILKKWPTSGPKEVWRETLGSGYSGISIANGVAYTLYGDSRYEYCIALDTQNGKRVWKKRIGYLYENGWGDGPRATPTIDSDKVYVLGGHGDLSCFKSRTGKRIWSMNILQKFGDKNLTWGISGSPFIYKDLLLYNIGGITAFNKKTGKVVWRNSGDRKAYSTPILIDVNGKEQIVFFTANGAVGVDPNNRGKVLWRYDWKTSYDVNAATPIFHDNHLYISSGYNSGAALVKITPSGSKYKITEVWRTPQMKNHFSSSILWEGNIYGFHNAILKCMDFKTGAKKWTKRGFSKGSLVAVDGHMIILGEKGSLAMAKLTPQGYQEVSSARPFAPGTKSWTVPTVSNGHLFIRNEKEIVCFKLK